MNTSGLDSIIAKLKGARILSPLELNDIRFSERKTVLTPGRLHPATKATSQGKNK